MDSFINIVKRKLGAWETTLVCCHRVTHLEQELFQLKAELVQYTKITLFRTSNSFSLKNFALRTNVSE